MLGRTAMLHAGRDAMGGMSDIKTILLQNSFCQLFNSQPLGSPLQLCLLEISEAACCLPNPDIGMLCWACKLVNAHYKRRPKLHVPGWDGAIKGDLLLLSCQTLSRTESGPKKNRCVCQLGGFVSSCTMLGISHQRKKCKSMSVILSTISGSQMRSGLPVVGHLQTDRKRSHCRRDLTGSTDKTDKVWKVK